MLRNPPVILFIAAHAHKRCHMIAKTCDRGFCGTSPFWVCRYLSLSLCCCCCSVKLTMRAFLALAVLSAAYVASAFPFEPSIVCPDGSSQCPDGDTCCKTTTGDYGCCPLPNAECCSDGLHCCPSGYTCNVAAGTCTKGDMTVPFFTKIEAKPKDVVCPGGQYTCPDGDTCCKLATGDYGCCPLPKAVCCSDMLHCCPEGDTCDVSAGTCTKGGMTVPFFTKIEAKPKDVVCPGGQYTCPDGDTCCMLATGDYGCCPLPKAVCCSDMLHCCPEGDTCDVAAGTCTKGDMTVPFFTKIEAKPKDVVCPGGQYTCPDGDTCCKLPTGDYGCCPLPNAECCSDGLHCCPSGYTCNVAAGTCTKGDMTVPFFTKVEAKPKDVVCPGGQYTCPDGDTCCMLATGDYGCCPLPKAVCCSDMLHCCPEGDTCDVSAGTCTKGEMTVPFFTKIEAKPKYIVCPDGSDCPTGDTCCKISSFGYGCCPLPNAVCCSDETHCCPEGYTCDVSAGTCTKGEMTVPFFTKVEDKPKNVICPDGTSQCPDGDTCCKISSGGYGCCPLPKAVCCSDMLHCCPEGDTCDVSAGTCNKEGETIPFFLKRPALFPPKKDQWV